MHMLLVNYDPNVIDVYKIQFDDHYRKIEEIRPQTHINFSMRSNL